MSLFANNQAKGIFYISISALAFGSYGVWSKLMGDSFGDWSQGWIRGLMIVMLLVPVGIWKKSFKKIEKKDVLWFFLFSLGGLNQAPIYYAFHNLTIGTATVLFYAALVLAGYGVGFIVLKERVEKVKILSLLCSLIGIGILFDFSSTANSLLPMLSALLAGTLAGVEVTITKKISHKYSTIQILTSVFIMMVIGNILPSILLHDTVPSSTELLPWAAQTGYTASMIIAMYTVVKGFKYIEASIGSLVGLTEILFATLLGIVLFHEQLTSRYILASFLIVAAAAFPTLQQVMKLKTK